MLHKKVLLPMVNRGRRILDKRADTWPSPRTGIPLPKSERVLPEIEKSLKKVDGRLDG